MALLKMFRKPAPPLQRLPAGTFTVDSQARLLISTLSSAFPAELIHEVGEHVVNTFREARKAELPLFELTVHCSSLKIVARELRGGAIVFLTPLTPMSAKQ